MAHFFYPKEGTMKVVKNLLGYAIPLFILCGVVDYFTFLPMEGATKWVTFLVASLMISVAAMTWGNRRPLYDLENKYRVSRRVSDTERDAKRW